MVDHTHSAKYLMPDHAERMKPDEQLDADTVEDVPPDSTDGVSISPLAKEIRPSLWFAEPRHYTDDREQSILHVDRRVARCSEEVYRQAALVKRQGGK